MPIKMKELPESERPYEKLEQYGSEKLTNAELLAIIIKKSKDSRNYNIWKRCNSTNFET